MDFGKKGDAKKAMKLMWKEGITLKQAWKRVKGKESKKKSSKSSPRKRKAQAMAKKAMKLKWKEGITLKQAWKKVNKFGDTVCPDGYEPNVMWTGKAGQRQCVQICGPGMFRDPATNRCKKIPVAEGGSAVRRRPTWPWPRGMEINPETGRLRKVCLPPSMRNAKGRCVAPKAEVIAPPGTEINPETGRLRKVCLPGQYRDPVTKRCRRIKEEPLLIDAPVPILEPLLAGGQMAPSDYRGSTYIPPGMAVFGKYGRYKYGSRRCGFGSCKVCAL
tara:strand:- start:324 stop:1145 length:822 start_codon:yes stop_codon:yes gene_type:complete